MRGSFAALRMTAVGQVGMRGGSGFLGRQMAEAFAFFDEHVVVLDGVEDFTAGLALNELSVFRAGDDLDDGVFAGGGH